MKKFCFVISPMGDEESSTRKRADFVLNTYIRPACEKAGFEAVRADHGIIEEIDKGLTTTLSNAPMAIAYMGSPSQCQVTSCSGSSFWNANVMLEVGYRLASRLPLLLLCDRGADGKVTESQLPMILKARNVMALPANTTNGEWEDPSAEEKVEKLANRIVQAQFKPRYLDSIHGLATIHAANWDTQDPNNLFYTAASELAESLFGITENRIGSSITHGQYDPCAKRLVGRSMAAFLDGVEERMHPVQWSKFEQDQKKVRRELKEPSSAKKSSTAAVPIVFESHEDDRFNHRAYLPIITQDYRPSDSNWYSLRVLYLNVTSVARKETGENGEEFYVCDLDPTSDVRLEPLKFCGTEIKIFISYSSRHRPVVMELHDKLNSLIPYIDVFSDAELLPGENWLHAIMKNLSTAEACLLLLDNERMGDGEKKELELLLASTMTTAVEKKCRIIPILLGDQREVPFSISTINPIFYSQLDDSKLREIFSGYFPNRCPADWKPKKSMAKRITRELDEPKQKSMGDSKNYDI